MSYANELSRRLAARAEAVWRAYLPAGRRNGRYWIAGDAQGTHGKSLFVKLSGDGAGRCVDYVALLVMLRRRDWALSYRRLTASTQHNVSVSREVS